MSVYSDVQILSIRVMEAYAKKIMFLERTH